MVAVMASAASAAAAIAIATTTNGCIIPPIPSRSVVSTAAFGFRGHRGRRVLPPGLPARRLRLGGGRVQERGHLRGHTRPVAVLGQAKHEREDPERRFFLRQSSTFSTVTIISITMKVRGTGSRGTWATPWRGFQSSPSCVPSPQPMAAQMMTRLRATRVDSVAIPFWFSSSGRSPAMMYMRLEGCIP